MKLINKVIFLTIPESIDILKTEFKHSLSRTAVLSKSQNWKIVVEIEKKYYIPFEMIEFLTKSLERKPQEEKIKFKKEIEDKMVEIKKRAGLTD